MKSFDQIRLEYVVKEFRGTEHLFRAISSFAAEAWMKSDEAFAQIAGSSFNAVTGDDCKQYNIGKYGIRRVTNEVEFLSMLEKECPMFKKYVASDLAGEQPCVDTDEWDMHCELDAQLGQQCTRPLFWTAHFVYRVGENMYTVCSQYKKITKVDGKDHYEEVAPNKEWLSCKEQDLASSLRAFLEERRAELVDEQIESCLRGLAAGRKYECIFF